MEQFNNKPSKQESNPNKIDIDLIRKLIGNADIDGAITEIEKSNEGFSKGLRSIFEALKEKKEAMGFEEYLLAYNALSYSILKTLESSSKNSINSIFK